MGAIQLETLDDAVTAITGLAGAVTYALGGYEVTGDARYMLATLDDLERAVTAARANLPDPPPVARMEVVEA